MIEIEIGPNDADQRLDRFLRKYLRGASLSRIYRMIRKDVKVNGSRAGNETVLQCGDRLSLYLKEEELRRYHPENMRGRTGAGKNFSVAYEDENILAAVKPFGLLTHGDGREKKHTLVNQVTDYLIGKGEYVPRVEKSFSPAAVNRLDRNTTGLVLFGKNGMALRTLNRMMKDKDAVGKYYLTVLCGVLKEERILLGNLEKDEKKNLVTISKTGRAVETRVRPVAYSSDGRSHLRGSPADDGTDASDPGASGFRRTSRCGGRKIRRPFRQSGDVGKIRTVRAASSRIPAEIFPRRRGTGLSDRKRDQSGSAGKIPETNQLPVWRDRISLKTGKV